MLEKEFKSDTDLRVYNIVREERETLSLRYSTSDFHRYCMGTARLTDEELFGHEVFEIYVDLQRIDGKDPGIDVVLKTRRHMLPVLMPTPAELSDEDFSA